MEWIPLIFVGLIAGVFSGLFGIGGGVVIVPILVVFFAYAPTQAFSTSLAALLLPVSILAVVSYYRAKRVDVRASILLAIGIVTTTVIGASISLSLPADTLKQIYGVFLAYIGWRFAEPRVLYAEWRKSRGLPNNAPAHVDRHVDNPHVAWWVLLLIGMFTGVAAGMFGIGGGVVIVPILVSLYRYEQKLAAGTSLAALLPPVGLPGVIRYYSAGTLDVGFALLVALGLLFGAMFGAKIALGLPSRTVRRMYGLFLLFVSFWFIIQPFVIALANRR